MKFNEHAYETVQALKAGDFTILSDDGKELQLKTNTKQSQLFVTFPAHSSIKSIFCYLPNREYFSFYEFMTEDERKEITNILDKKVRLRRLFKNEFQ